MEQAFVYPSGGTFVIDLESYGMDIAADMIAWLTLKFGPCTFAACDTVEEMEELKAQAIKRYREFNDRVEAVKGSAAAAKAKQKALSKLGRQLDNKLHRQGIKLRCQPTLFNLDRAANLRWN